MTAGKYARSQECIALQLKILEITVLHHSWKKHWIIRLYCTTAGNNLSQEDTYCITAGKLDHKYVLHDSWKIHRSQVCIAQNMENTLDHNYVLHHGRTIQ